jgi:lysozyme family protein
MNFDEIFDRLLGHEGGYVNHPADPGSETNWGISKRTYPNVNIKKLTREGAKEIYRRDFWQPLNGDRLYDGVAYQLFDFAVNSGINTAIRAYQRALGVADDGYFGKVSLARSASMSESDQIMRLLAERIDFMRKLNTWQSFGKGWMGRIAGNLRYGAIDS